MAPKTLSQRKIHTRLDRIAKKPEMVQLGKLLVRPEDAGVAASAGRRKGQPPGAQYLQQVSSKVSRGIQDNRMIYQLLPDIELAQQIITSSILSPNDMVKTELNFTCSNADIPADVAAALLAPVSEYFSGVYNIDRRLNRWLEEMLFEKGSVPMLVMPTSAIDTLINGASVSTEAFTQTFGHDGMSYQVSRGFLGTRTSDQTHHGLESLMSEPRFTPQQAEIKDHPSLSVTDNFDILKRPMAEKALRTQRVRKKVYANPALEAYIDKLPMAGTDEDPFNENSVQKKLYQDRSGTQKKIVDHAMPDYDRESYGHPMVMDIPPEAVIPVFPPGSPEDHIGYYLLLDRTGNPISRTREIDHYSSMTQSLRDAYGDNNSFARNSMSKIMQQNGSMDLSSFGETHANEIMRLYSEAIDKDLAQRVTNGIYGGEVELGDANNLYQVMLKRSLANKQTLLLYVPAEMMVYMAMDYSEYGTGKSLLEDNKIIAMINAMLLFANTMAEVYNSIPQRLVNITLDEDDTDPEKTVDELMTSFMNMNRMSFPMGASQPDDFMQSLGQAGITLNVEGNSRYPQTRMEVSDNSSSRVEVNSELMDKMRDRYLRSLGLQPEMIDMAKEANFAISIASSNLMFSKRVIQDQDVFTPQVDQFVQVYTRGSGELRVRMLEALKGLKSRIPKEWRQDLNQFVDVFIDSLVTTLPRPDTTTLESQMAAYDNYSRALDEMIEAYLNEDIYEIQGADDVSASIRPAIAIIKSHYLRSWMQKHNVMPELQDLVTYNDSGEDTLTNIFELTEQHIDTMGKTLGGMLEKLNKDHDKRTADTDPSAEGGEDNPDEEPVTGDGDEEEEPGTDLPDEEQEETGDLEPDPDAEEPEEEDTTNDEEEEEDPDNS